MRRPTHAAALLGLLVTVSTLLRFWGGTLVPTPWIAPEPSLVSTTPLTMMPSPV